MLITPKSANLRAIVHKTSKGPTKVTPYCLSWEFNRFRYKTPIRMSYRLEFHRAPDGLKIYSTVYEGSQKQLVYNAFFEKGEWFSP